MYRESRWRHGSRKITQFRSSPSQADHTSSAHSRGHQTPQTWQCGSSQTTTKNKPQSWRCTLLPLQMLYSWALTPHSLICPVTPAFEPGSAIACEKHPLCLMLCAAVSTPVKSNPVGLPWRSAIAPKHLRAETASQTDKRPRSTGWKVRFTLPNLLSPST